MIENTYWGTNYYHALSRRRIVKEKIVIEKDKHGNTISEKIEREYELVPDYQPYKPYYEPWKITWDQSGNTDYTVWSTTNEQY